MDITFNCERCGQHIAIEATAAGTQINCPTCKHVMQVPEPPKPEATEKPPIPPLVQALNPPESWYAPPVPDKKTSQVYKFFGAVGLLVGFSFFANGMLSSTDNVMQQIVGAIYIVGGALVVGLAVAVGAIIHSAEK